MLWNYGDVWHYRAIAIARSVADRSLLEKVKTLTIKESTDVQMKDADVELTTRKSTLQAHNEVLFSLRHRRPMPPIQPLLVLTTSSTTSPTRRPPPL